MEDITIEIDENEFARALQFALSMMEEYTEFKKEYEKLLMSRNYSKIIDLWMGIQ